MKRHTAVQTLFALALVLLVAAPVLAQKRIKDLKYPPLNAFEVPRPEKIVLDNGLVLYLLEDHDLPLVNLSARLLCGSYLEPEAKTGLAGITGDVMRTGGTESQSGDAIDERLEAKGASVETGIQMTSGFASANALSEYAETVIGLLADILRRPVFAEDKIELAKTEMRAEISRRNDDPFAINLREFRKLIYGRESPYARQTEYATIDLIRRDDLVAYHRAFIQPNTAQLAIWGDFKTADMVALVNRYFGDWARGTTDIPKPPDVTYEFEPTVNYAEKTDVNQSNIFLGHIGGKMGDSDYAAATVMNSILGGAFGSRLFNQVRTKEGLAYAVSGTYTFNFDFPGFFYVFCATKSGSTVKAIEECKKEIRRMQTDLPTPEEMRLAKDGYLNSFVFNFDTKSEVINRMMTYDYYGFPPDYLQTIKEALEKVTPEDVIAVAQRKLHPDALQIMVTGKADEFDSPLTALGTVTAIDISIPRPAGEDFQASDEELAQGQVLLAKCVDACGGAARFRKVDAFRREARLTMNMPQGAMTLDVITVRVIPDKLHMTMKTPMGEQTLAYDGQAGWMGMGGQSQPLPAAQIADMKSGFAREFFWLFRNLNGAEFRVAHKGEEDFADGKAARLDFLTRDNQQFTLFVNPTTFRPLGMRYMGQSMAGPALMTETYLELKDVKGMLVPSKVDRDEGAMTVQYDVVKWEINPTVDAALFALPDKM